MPNGKTSVVTSSVLTSLIKYDLSQIFGEIQITALVYILLHRLKRCELTTLVFEELGSLLRSGTSRLKSLSVGINHVGDQGVKPLLDAVAHPNCLLEDLE